MDGLSCSSSRCRNGREGLKTYLGVQREKEREREKKKKEKYRREIQLWM
jgi:hypothetical protein